MNQMLKEKIKSLAKKMMYFGCLQPMEDGQNKTPCKKILPCTTCKEKHPTTLHGYTPKNRKFIGDGNLSQNNHEKVKSYNV